MKIARRSFVSAIFVLGAAFAVAAPASAQEVGKDYSLISPTQPTEDKSKIEVSEFFSYGCPHCSDFHPMVSAWAAKLPSDVVFKKVPITFNRGAWANIAKLYYSLKITGDLDRLESDVFKAIHVDRANLFEPAALADWVAKKGVDTQKFNEAFKSFGVASQVKRGDQMAVAYKVQGVPALAIDGKYMVGGKDFKEQLEIADKLIAKARAEKAGKK